jgi:hypothetical protein
MCANILMDSQSLSEAQANNPDNPVVQAYEKNFFGGQSTCQTARVGDVNKARPRCAILTPEQCDNEQSACITKDYGDGSLYCAAKPLSKIDYECMGQ